MKKSILIAVLTASIATSAFAQWKPAGDKIKTKWAEQVNPENVLPEYPRPVMERGEWKNLNGLWNYAITEKGAAPFSLRRSDSGSFCHRVQPFGCW